MFRRISITVSLIALTPAATFVARAQQGAAAITGVVTDQPGAVIIGAPSSFGTRTPESC
jgi:hypothetical protein